MAGSVSIRSIGIKYGLITTSIFIAYFLLLRAFGLFHVIGLRVFNYAFPVSIGLYLALRSLRQQLDDHIMSFLQTIGLGFIVVFFTSLFFSIFVFFYTQFMDPAFLGIIRGNLPYYHGNLNALMVAIYIFIECFLFGLILGLIVVQIFKRNPASDKEPEDKVLEQKHINNNL